jgi:hypothetical protein
MDLEFSLFLVKSSAVSCWVLTVKLTPLWKAFDVSLCGIELSHGSHSHRVLRFPPSRKWRIWLNFHAVFSVRNEYI